MTGRPLRPVTDHRLGRLLPHQQANRTQAPPKALPLRAAFLRRDYAVLAKVSLGYPPLLGRFLRVPHPSAARHQLVQALIMLPLDLHVLSVPPAFNLSQDQTLHFFKSCSPSLQAEALRSRGVCSKSDVFLLHTID